MLPRWPERLTAILDRCGVELRGRSGVLGQFPCAPDPRQAAWQAALDALADALERFARRPANLSVVLRCDLVRLELLPWCEDIASREEFEAYARFTFEEIYGVAARDWVIATAPAGGREAVLGAAMDRALLVRLGELATARGLRLRSVQPSLAALLRHRRLPRECLLLLAEAGRACAALVRRGRWEGLCCTPDEDRDEALHAALERACHLFGLDRSDMPPVLVSAPRRPTLDVPPVCGVRPQRFASV